MGSFIKDHVDLNITQTRLLAEVYYERSDNRIGEISHTLQIAPNRATAVVKTLGARGLLTRSSDSGDARSVILHATEEGHQALEQVEVALAEYHHSLRRLLKREQLDRLATIANRSAEAAGCLYLLDDKPVFMMNYLNCCAINLGRITTVSKRYGLNLIEIRMLAALTTMRSDPRISTLSTRLGLRPNVISVAIDDLEKLSFAYRFTDPDDHRAVRISTTPSGDAAFQQVATEVIAQISVPFLLLQDVPDAVTAHLHRR